MDEQVRLALAKWPAVPDCTGWLALDARGRWRIGDPKEGPRQPITHAAMNAFINRNYAPQERCWIFQNGPQRVFVELEYTPYVWRLAPREDAGWDLVAHVGTIMTPSAIWLDSDGRFLFQAGIEGKDAVVGVLHDHDTSIIVDLLRADDGGPLADDALALLSAAVPAERGTTEMARAKLCWRTDTTLALRHIASSEVAVHFAFEPRPALAMRLDLDMRR